MAHSLLDYLRKAQADAPSKWDVMVVPDSANAMPATFHVSRTKLQMIAAGVVATVVVTLLLWAGTLFSAHARRRSEVHDLEARLDADRAAMQQELEDARTSMEQVRSAMAPLLETENKMRAIAGLQPRYRDPEVGTGGQGGRGEYHEVDDAADLIDPADVALPVAPDWSDANVEALLSEFTLLQESYGEIEQALTQEADRLDNTPLINPVDHPDAWISSGYGYRSDPFKQSRRFHEGIDIVAPRGASILAPANGTVTFAGWKAGLGKLVVIKHQFGFETEYAHCDRLAVKKGETVVRGQTIAYLGSTGRSTGPHLHYEVRKGGKLVNPYRYIIN